MPKKKSAAKNKPKKATHSSGPRLQERRSGVLCHVSSLPSPFYLGDLGKEALAMADLLAEAKQSWWQMLPVNPIGLGNSPYATICSMAGEPLFISVEKLARDGLLTEADVELPAGGASDQADYERAREYRLPLWRKAFESFKNRFPSEKPAFEAFKKRNSAWLADFSLFSVLSEAFATTDWSEWPSKLARRNARSLAEARQQYAERIFFVEFLQYQFCRQWRELKAHCAERGIGLIGDMPIFVSHQSSDVWANQKIFYLGRDGKPSYVAGVPPDYFNPEGQRWGNALYKWEAMAEDGYGWWVQRLGKMLELFDAIRLDHFIGFHRFWKIPAHAASAKTGKWTLAPGSRFFKAVKRKLGDTPFIAEDLGSVTPEVWALRDQFAMPGMRVLQFGFMNGEGASYHLPHEFVPGSVVYPGTHDNDTIAGWYESAVKERDGDDASFDVAKIQTYLGAAEAGIGKAMIRSAMTSVANLSITMIQDVLGLGGSTRMNQPGTASGNWAWRLTSDSLNKEAFTFLASLTTATGRSEPV